MITARSSTIRGVKNPQQHRNPPANRQRKNDVWNARTFMPLQRSPSKLPPQPSRRFLASTGLQRTPWSQELSLGPFSSTRTTCGLAYHTSGTSHPLSSMSFRVPLNSSSRPLRSPDFLALPTLC